MRASTDLRKFWRRFQLRAYEVRLVFKRVELQKSHDKYADVSFGIIELDNLILCALREYLVSSLVGARSRTGSRITANRPFYSEAEISAFILSVLHLRKFQNMGLPSTIDLSDEPTMRDPKNIEKVLIAAGASNLPNFQRALGLNLREFIDLGTTRNYFAHKKEDTRRKLQKKILGLGILSDIRPEDLPFERLPGRPLPIFEEWIISFTNFFDFALE